VFRLRNVQAPPEETWPDLRLCIDTEEDRALLERVFDALYAPGRVLPVAEVIAWLRDRPEVVALNTGVQQKTTFGRVF
jgi:spore coat polysaccharide biosynthesis protein SpsF